MGTVTEPERLALRQWAGEHMNELAAEGFMKSLPPKGWDDLATKADLVALETKTDTKFEALEAKIDTMGTVLAATFTAKLATEIGEVHKQIGEVHKLIGDVRGGMRGQTITLIVTIVVAFLGQGAMARYLPPAQPPAPQVIIQSPGK